MAHESLSDSNRRGRDSLSVYQPRPGVLVHFDRYRTPKTSQRKPYAGTIHRRRDARARNDHRAVRDGLRIGNRSGDRRARELDNAASTGE